jgi:hypothetical protein
MAIPVSNVLKHWTKMFPFCSMSSAEFYGLVDKIFKEHQIPDVKLERINHKEGGMFSSSREYFRIKRKDLVFDICAAPFGKDFFISWWLYETEGITKQLLKLTSVGSYLVERSAKQTFFQADEETMFLTCAHECILEAVEQMVQSKGLRGLTDQEKLYNKGGL